MLRLDTTTRSLQILLGSAITTSQSPVIVSYSDKSATNYLGATQTSSTNSTTAVTICSAPAASTIRDIDYVSITNADTVSETVTIVYNDNGAFYNIISATLQVGDTLVYTHAAGWKVTSTSSVGNLNRQLFVSGTGYTAGTSTALTLSNPPNAATNIWIYFDGAFQQSSEYSVNGSVVTFTSAIPLGVAQIEVITTTPLSLNVSTNSTVTTTSTNSTFYPTLVNASSGNLALNTGSGLTFNPGTSTLTSTNIITSSMNGGPLAGFRNRIINGGCIINQRNNTGTFSTATSGYAGPDRFQATNSGAAGGSFTQAQQSLSFGGLTLPTVRQTVVTAISNSTGTNYWSGITQYIEGYNAYDLNGKTITVSFIFNTNVSGTFSAVLYDGSASRSYVTTFSATANTPSLVSFTTTSVVPSVITNTNSQGLGISVGLLNAGTYQTSTLNSWQTGIFRSASTATNWGSTTGNFIELTQLQIEIGTTATPFEFRPYGTEIALCQRYYAQVKGDVQTPTTVGVATTTSAIACNAKFPVTMRADPTVSIFSYSNTLNKISVFGSSTDVGTTVTAATAQISTNSFIQINDSATGFTANTQYWFWYSALSEL